MSLELKTHLDEQDPKLFSNKEEKLLNPSARVQNSEIYSKSIRCQRSTSRGSKSPRYRSPTHSKLLQDSSSRLPCKTCMKRSIESNLQTFHDSPPRVRPSHHNIVCSSCSAGSYSKILKVVCLNSPRESKSETTRVKITENFKEAPNPSQFPMLGSGQSYQVHYEEVLLPPKTELTSLVPETSKENWLRYQLKEEERKRVVIRRAEYANRMKGLSKTVVATFALGEKTRLEEDPTGEANAEIDDQEELKACIEQDFTSGLKSNQNTKPASKSNSRSKPSQPSQPSHQSKPPKKTESKRSQERGRSLDLNSHKEPVNKYFQKIRDESLKRNLEQSKVSVKHKILARLAEKDFAHLLNLEEKAEKEEVNEKMMTSENSLAEEQDESRANVDGSFNFFESIEGQAERPVSQINMSDQVKENNSNFLKSFEDSHNLSDTFDISMKSPEISEESSLILKENPNDRPKSSQAHSSKLSSPLLKIEEHSEHSSYYVKTLENDERLESIIEKEASNLNNSNKFIEKFENSPDLNDKQDLDEGSSEELIEFSSKSIEDSIRKSREGSISKEKEIEKSFEEYEEVKKKLLFVGNPFEDSPQAQGLTIYDHSDVENYIDEYTNQISFEDLTQIPYKEVKDSQVEVLAPINKNFKSESENENENENEVSVADIEASQNSQEKFEATDQDKAPEKLDLRQDEENQIKSNENQILEEEKKQASNEDIKPEDSQSKDFSQGLHLLITTLSDPQVVKGLKLLGGFADYLERFGGTVLDFHEYK